MSEVKVNKISPRTNCGTTTLGDSGDSFVIPSGVTITNNGTQTGFGRTGTVNWQTSIKTGDFTAVSGEGYFVNTTSGEIDVTLPSSPSAGDIVSLKDYAGNWATNNCIVLRNGSNMDGSAANQTFNTNGLSLTLIYMDATKGWSLINDDETSTLGASYITATGGSTSTCGNFKIHTFTGPGTFTVSCAGNAGGSNTIEYLVVAGGGGGGGDLGGGGGAGGYRTVFPSPATGGLPVTATGYPVTVGGGGTAPSGPQPGAPITASGSGSNSVFSGSSTITSAGGGGGGQSQNPYGGCAGANGGSGGGNGGYAPVPAAGGTGNTPPVNPPQGNNGGSGGGNNNAYPGGGGGGAAAVGGSAGNTTSAGQAGGAGSQNNIDGNNYYWAGGGGGAAYQPGPAAGNGGIGGGGGGGKGGGSGPTTFGTGGGSAINAGSPGTGNNPESAGVQGGAAGANSGGGGGAGGHNSSPGIQSGSKGGNGGSGIVIIRYKFQ